MQVVIQGFVFTVYSEEAETFRCGKTITTVVLRKDDTEIKVSTAGDWKTLLSATQL